MKKSEADKLEKDLDELIRMYSPGADGEENERLRKEVAELHQRVEKLEGKLSLEKWYRKSESRERRSEFVADLLQSRYVVGTGALFAAAAGAYYLSDNLSATFSTALLYVVNTMKGLAAGAGAGMAAMVALMASGSEKGHKFSPGGCLSLIGFGAVGGAIVGAITYNIMYNPSDTSYDALGASAFVGAIGAAVFLKILISIDFDK